MAIDAVPFILSSNERRHHMSKGARAMVAAQIRKVMIKSSREAAKEVGTGQAYIVRASIVLEYAPELADSVIAGAMLLNEAYAEAQKRKEAKQSDEFKIARLRRLPEFANQAHTPFKR
jgi:hypothetical protein